MCNCGNDKNGDSKMSSLHVAITFTLSLTFSLVQCTQHY